VRRPNDATVEGGPPEAAGEAEYAEIFMLHCLYPVSLLDPDPFSSSSCPFLIWLSKHIWAFTPALYGLLPLHYHLMVRYLIPLRSTKDRPRL
jgi:hypothetical protein